ncbi:hypothetical protein DV515_00007437 [Chloebia gouldiae]|uniref:Uncharacterized protein n=1 Tax=Chloebia gouldiae TaxID=44316 RepID=A0A3L8SHI7_CHLGU|nr:hypothetical protein DV515_00007437 [Chloebia gouldiae]
MTISRKPPCQNKERKSCALLGGLNHRSVKERNRTANFPHGSLEPSFPGECSTSVHRHARASSTLTNLPLQGPTRLLAPPLRSGFASLGVNGAETPATVSYDAEITMSIFYDGLSPRATNIFLELWELFKSRLSSPTAPSAPCPYPLHC